MRPTDPELPLGLRELVATVLRPWGDPAAAIDAYEDLTRAAADAQLAAARALDHDAARAIVVLWADLTRDVGAVQVSTLRWVLDV